VSAMAKARVGLYEVSGETLTRTHKSCPKCGPGVFLAEHGDRRSCGRCGYSESKAPPPAKPKPVKSG
jgi:ubiquitin-small subunit ribosomal protein S27Ae